MPITIIRMTLVIAPSALPTALVRRPTEPSNCEPRFDGGPFGIVIFVPVASAMTIASAWGLGRSE